MARKAFSPDETLSGEVKRIVPFRSPRVKVRRARLHVQNLSDETEKLNAEEIETLEFKVVDPNPIAAENRNPHDFSTWFSPETQSWVVNPLPDDFSAIIGDAVHNLRSALDTLACDLVRLNGRSTRDVYFPFCAKPEDTHKTIAERNITRARSDVVALFERLAIYPDATISLRTIHDLDVVDKHQFLIDGIIMGARTPFNGVHLYLDAKFRPIFQHLGKNLSFLNEADVIVTLERLVEQTARTVEAFALLYDK